LKEIREVLSDAKKEYVVIKDEGIAQMTDEANKKEIAMDTIAKLTAAEKKAKDRVEGKTETEEWQHLIAMKDSFHQKLKKSKNIL
jgi:hypothetical protein